MPVLRPSGSDFTSFVKASAQYVPPGRAGKTSTSGAGAMLGPIGLGAIVRTSQVGALASPGSSAVFISGVTPPRPPPPPGPIPLSISGLKLWLDGSDTTSIASNASSNVLVWSNLAGGPGALPVNTTTRPLFVASSFNSLGSIQFPTGTRLKIDPITYVSPYRCIIAVLTIPTSHLNNFETPFFGGDEDRVGSNGFIAYDHPNGVEYQVPGNVRQTETATGLGNYPRPPYNSTPWMMGIQTSSTAGAKLYYNGNINRSNLSNSTFPTGAFNNVI